MKHAHVLAMKKILAAFVALLFPLAALAQGAPPNCPDSGGNHLNYTSATHAWACGTSSSGSSTSVILTPANPDVYLTRYGAKQLMISGDGVGATTNAGVIAGYAGSSGYSGIWNSATTPSTTAAGVVMGASGDVVHNFGSGGSWSVYGNGSQRLLQPSTVGAGPTISAGTAVTDVAALSVTRTNNNAAVATGVKFTFTDTTGAAGFLPFQVLGGAAGTTNLISVGKGGSVVLGGSLVANSFVASATTSYVTAGNADAGIGVSGSVIGVLAASGRVIGFSSTTNWSGATDTAFSRISAGVVGVGTGAAAAVDGTLAATNYHVAAKPVILGTAPTIASGGCTSPTVTNTNGTAYFTIDVGTSCSGSQPVVFTLPAATTGWNCYARNVTNGATSAPAQTGAISTTSVTITNFNRTTGIAAAWTDADDVTVSCLGG